jgi:hypothetical protein
MHEVVELVRALAWPVTIFALVLLLRKEVQLLGSNLAARVRTDTIVIGRSGLTRKAPASSQLQDRKLRFRRFVAANEDEAVLDSIAKRLGLPTGMEVSAARKAIVVEMNRRVSSDLDMDQISATLKRITKQDF